MSQLARRVATYIARNGLFAAGQAVVVGVSGGADSLCLLHVLAGLAPRVQIRLHVAHLNHGLRGAEADADAAFVQDLAGAWGLPVTVGAEDVRGYARDHRLALEEAARQVRYAFLARVAAEAGAARIAVAHHADDQAETVLMHFLRGSGAAGLRGMLPCMPLTDYRALSARAATDATDLLLVRPLLSESRAEIDAYCAEYGLTPRIDSTNADVRLHRNRMRHELLPILRAYNPNIDAVLRHTAEVMAGDYEVLQDATAAALAAVEIPPAANDGHPSVSFDLAGWRALPVGLQRATVRAAVVRLRRTLRNINWDHVEHAVRVGRSGHTGDAATIAAGLALTVGYTALVVGPERSVPTGSVPTGDVPTGDVPTGDVPTGSVPTGSVPTGSLPQLAAAVRLAAPGVTELGGGWRVRIALLAAPALPDDFARSADPWTAHLDADLIGPDLLLRRRQPGDRFRPLGLDGHSVRLNEYMINVKVPAAARAGWPILEGERPGDGRGIVWVCGLRVDAAAAIHPGTTRAWQVRFER